MATNFRNLLPHAIFLWSLWGILGLSPTEGVFICSQYLQLSAMNEDLKREIKSQGNKTSQIIYGLHNLYGQVSRNDVAAAVGVSRQWMYTIANRHMVFQRGLRPTLIKSAKVKNEALPRAVGEYKNRRSRHV